MRLKEQASDRARLWASVVFPTPGTSSRSRWPRANRQTTDISMTESFPLITRAILSWMARMVRGEFMSGLSALLAQKLVVTGHGGSLTKGLEGVNCSAVSRAKGSAAHERNREGGRSCYWSGTSVTIQGGVSSTISRKRLAVLLAGMFGKTAPRRIWMERKPYEVSYGACGASTRGMCPRNVAQTERSGVSPIARADNLRSTSSKIPGMVSGVKG